MSVHWSGDCLLFLLDFEGLGVFSTSLTVELHYLASRASTKVLVSALQGDSFELATHEATVLSAKQDYASLRDAQFKQLFDDLLDQFDHIHQRIILCACFNSLSGWLTVLPTEKDHFNLTTQKFRDALAVRYQKPLMCLSPSCDGCGAPSSLDHALMICKKEGLIIQHHNELRDVIRDLAALVWRHVHCEPIIQDSSNEHDALVAELGIRGVWQPQAEALFDIRVIDTDTQSYQSHSHKVSWPLPKQKRNVNTI